MWLGFYKSDVIGKELVVNGDFSDGEADWVFGSNWSVVDKEAVVSGLGNNEEIYQSNNMISGNLYEITLDVSNFSIGTGSCYVTNSNYSDFLTITNNGSYVYRYIATNNTLFIRRKSNATFNIDNISVKEVTQFVKDKSSNSNDAKLFTGKALICNGNDYVDFGSDINNDGTIWTCSLWLSNYVSTSTSFIIGDDTRRNIGLNNGSGNVFYRSEDNTYNTFNYTDYNTDVVEARRLVFSSNGTTISLYVNGDLIDTITPSSTNLKVSRLMAGYNTTSFMTNGTASDFQIYNAAWDSDDALFDYNNPNHLVTDNPNTTLTLSNLSAYYALSEGSGSFAYNSATPLGSEVVVNGDFDGVVDGTDVSTLTNWYVNGTPTSTDVVNEEMVIVAAAIGDGARYNLSTTVGLTYHLTFNASGDLGASGVNIQSLGDVSTLGGVGRKTFTALSTTTKVYFRAGNNEIGTTNYDNISAKEVSSGTITGATYDDQQPTIPQLGLMDWAKSTIGSDEVTLIQAPNNKGYDILGNSLRLRERGFNLDGSGYAEVSDDNSIDMISQFTISLWLKPYVTYDSSMSTYTGVVSKASTGDSYAVSFTNSGVINIGTTGGNIQSTKNSWSADTWVNIVATYRAVNGVYSGEMYIDNSLEVLSNDSYDAMIGSVDPLLVGKGGSANFKGIIDEVLLYDRALTSKEVSTNYKTSLNAHKVGSAFSTEFSSEFGF